MISKNASDGWLFCLNMEPSCLDKPKVKPSMGMQGYVGVIKHRLAVMISSSSFVYQDS